MTVIDYHSYTKAPAPGAPLVFTFHGTGGNEMQFAELVGDILPAAGIVSPRGDVSEFGALRFFRRTGEGVYDMEDLAARTEKMAAFVEAQKAAYPGHPVYGLGYSNGANILASVVMVRPDLFDRVALLHPLIPWEPKDVKGLGDVDVFISAGERDPICPLPLTKRLADWFERQDAKLQTSIHPGGHEIRQTELQALGTFLQS